MSEVIFVIEGNQDGAAKLRSLGVPVDEVALIMQDLQAGGVSLRGVPVATSAAQVVQLPTGMPMPCLRKSLAERSTEANLPLRIAKVQREQRADASLDYAETQAYAAGKQFPGAKICQELASRISRLVDQSLRGRVKKVLLPRPTREQLAKIARRCNKAAKSDRSILGCRKTLETVRRSLATLAELTKRHPNLLNPISNELRFWDGLAEGAERLQKQVERQAESNPEFSSPEFTFFSRPFYQAQCDRTFPSTFAALAHYHQQGAKARLSPHFLLDPKVFPPATGKDGAASLNLIQRYRQALEQGERPATHAKFPAEWVAEYFTCRTRIPVSQAIIGEPKSLAEAITFQARQPIFVIGVILYQTPAEEISQVLSALRQAISQAELAGFPAPKIALTDNSHQWTDAGLQDLAIQAGCAIHFFPTESNIGFGRGHNHLMRHSFATLGVTHYFCLNPDGVLHPQALVALYRGLQHIPLPCLLEARQFPQEHPKYYDPSSLETQWCSGGCVLIPEFLFNLLGGYDDRFFMYCEDVDFSWRVWGAGYSCRVEPQALFHHKVASRPPATRQSIYMLESGRMLGHKWGDRKFQLECELLLVEQEHYGSVPELPALPDTSYEAIHAYVDFSHHFTFAPARW